jgi:hypothetical protein
MELDEVLVAVMAMLEEAGTARVAPMDTVSAVKGCLNSCNVCGKRAGQASESVTPLTLRTSPISTYNGSTQSLLNYFK